jgi:serine/threonine protein kinase
MGGDFLQVWEYIEDVASGLSHIHKHGVLHLDIKPDNIFIDGQGINSLFAIAHWEFCRFQCRFLCRYWSRMSRVPVVFFAVTVLVYGNKITVRRHASVSTRVSIVISIFCRCLLVLRYT